jgi:hypothetical protein
MICVSGSDQEEADACPSSLTFAQAGPFSRVATARTGSDNGGGDGGGGGVPAAVSAKLHAAAAASLRASRWYSKTAFVNASLCATTTPATVRFVVPVFTT